MTIRDIIELILRKMKIIVIFPVIAVTVVSYMNYTQQRPVYKATTILYTIDRATTNLTEIASVERLMPDYLLRAQTSEMRARVEEALGDSYQSCGVSMSMNVDQHTITISTSSGNPAVAANVANTYGSCIIDYLYETLGREDISILEAAHIPTSPSGPERQSAITTAGIVGVILGVLIVFLVEMSNNTVKGAEELEKEYGLPTLAEIGRYTKGKKKGGKK